MIRLLNLAVLSLLTFHSACHSKVNEAKLDMVQDSIADNKSTDILSSTKRALKDTTKENTICFIDTVNILSNQNLPPLIDELGKTKLIIHKTTAAIPAVILNFLKCSQSGDFDIANPGDNWQATDVIIEKLPGRQLIFFGVSDSIALMAHFTGGIGKSEHILIFKFNKKEVTNFWCGNVFDDLFDKQQTLEFLRKNMYKEWGLNTNIIYF